MALHVNSVTFDAANPAALAGFWSEVFQSGVPDVPNPYVAFVRPAGGPQLMFLYNENTKAAKNRCHLDLHADSEAQVDAEVARLTGQGATVVGTYREHGVYWTTLHDPEGNELCIGTPLAGHA